MYESLWADIQKLSQISKTFKCVIKCSVIPTLVLSVQLCCVCLAVFIVYTHAARPLTFWAILLCLKVKHFRRSLFHLFLFILLWKEKNPVSKNMNKKCQQKMILIFIFVFSCCSSMEKHEITSLTNLQGKKYILYNNFIILVPVSKKFNMTW